MVYWKTDWLYMRVHMYLGGILSLLVHVSWLQCSNDSAGQYFIVHNHLVQKLALQQISFVFQQVSFFFFFFLLRSLCAIDGHFWFEKSCSVRSKVIEAYLPVYVPLALLGNFYIVLCVTPIRRERCLMICQQAAARWNI